MDYTEHKKFFEIAYKTGSDIWTKLLFKNRGRAFVENLQKDSIILDIGSGRGLFAKTLAQSGYRVIGLDFEKNIVDKVNGQVKDWGLEGKLRFVEGDALDIPFEDNSFDGVCDMGLLDHLYKEDWDQYANEVNRVLKVGGFYLNISFSRETQDFLEFHPKGSEDGEFEKYGVHYHFFNKDEIKNIFSDKLIRVKQGVEFTEKPEKLALVETLFKKIK